MRKIKILFIGASLNYSSGLSYVLSSLMIAFKKTNRYEVGYCNLTGDQDVNYDTILKFQTKDFISIFNKPFPIFNSQITVKENINKLDSIILDFKPEIVFSIHDPWMFETIAFSAYRSKFFWVGCCTIETPFYPKTVIYPTHFNGTLRKDFSVMLNQADMIIPVTDMGKRVLLNLELKNVTDHIYLGMDFNLKCSSATKREAFGQHIPEDSFIFMTMGRNISRKKLDMVVLAFCEFLKTRQDKDRFKLYIHTNINEHKDGTDLLTMIVNLGLASHIILPKSFLNNVNPPIEELYRRYKACDCYIGLPGGEGFGYGFSQSMMHGKPIIYINYGGHAEYLQGRGLPVKPKGFYFADYIFMSFTLPDIDDAVIQMNKIADDENLRKELGKKAYDFAKENFDWVTQGKKFISTIEAGYDNCDKSLFNFNLKRVM